MKRIKYFAYYDQPEITTGRNIVLSAVNKIDYIIASLNKIGYAVDIVSFAGLNIQGYSSTPSETRKLGLNTLKLFRAFSGPCIMRPVFRWYMSLCFILWIMFNCKRGEEIIIYHSLGYASIFNFLQRFMKFRIIGEIEEIYQDVRNNFSSGKKRTEYEFLDNCSKYIFPSKILEKKINVRHKPSVIVHGVYLSQNIQVDKSDGLIKHIVYAGTFDPNKGGAQTAVLAARFLPENYHIHIIGFGTDRDTKELKALISHEQEESCAKIEYGGLLRGAEFNEFLQSCHVGLSTQNPEDSFNDTSFPSKVLTYMSNGLKVVTFRIAVLSTSQLDKSMFYAESNNAQDVAKAIINAVETSVNIDSASILRELDGDFLCQLKKIL